VFLDELPEMGARIQAKFLRVLESGEYTKALAGKKPISCLQGPILADFNL